MYGLLFFCVGLTMYATGVLLVFPRYLLGLNRVIEPIAEWLVWYSGIPLMCGLALSVFDILFMLQHKKPDHSVIYDPVEHSVTVALTAYNDEASIGEAVDDFRSHPFVKRVIVVSNNSKDRTLEVAREHGAIAFNEEAQGYGRCVFRCLSEAARYEDTPCIVLCEGDSTFRAYDIEKLLAYAPHVDVVNGTRTVEPLRQYRTQLSSFMYYGNLFVGKLLEAKHLGRGTITDVGTTYKLCRREALIALLPVLNPAINLEFNAHFLDVALGEDKRLVECPVTFHPRVGESKGGNVNDVRALRVGIRMIIGIVTNWKMAA